jgi:tryptophanyl-tRNA synthetase
MRRSPVCRRIGCVECKNRLVESIARELIAFQERHRELADTNGYVRDVLHEGARKARAMISETTAKVRDATGIDLF